MQFIKIPEERINILIGVGGSVKRKIEKKTKCKIEVEGSGVSIDGDGLSEWVCKEVVHAIGRGFNPEKALLLARDDYAFEYLDLTDYASTVNSRTRLKGRIIGENGRTRKHIEKSTGAFLSIYGKTVGIIGEFENVSIAKEAVTMLLSGSRHATVYKHMEKLLQKRRIQ